ncbi:cytochrome c-type biogenesis CcmF C-terminal domain-containing protein [Methanonatronarchaeum sp. AMET-Sl]|uniref:cytochrome c-type biogenesis CcmF C-terminal domain-containing protein n=1 Tax=Methanonatronarchaeum sp. AMET-Sl TaxID=3037654 RepID=UPI00244DD06B|nr:cytochrome c-type biogenesis CcmF C-terminal domain-containing protein [Methanonatronarchaeum sp. AMET-Sl]WGI16698.1 cytochrome c-type biogenesis CcmF C-terminal domain-containing protein [Methanonatronarchaeum sp. AMET-Sl]
MKPEDLNIQNLTTLTTILLGIISIVIFLGIILGIGPEFKSYYNTRTAPIMLAILYVLTTCYLIKYIDKKKTTKILSILLLAPIIFYFISPIQNIYIDLSLPILITLLILLSIDLIKQTKKGSKKHRIKKTGATVIHISIVLILIGVLATSTMGIQQEQTLEKNEVWDFNEYQIEFIEYEETEKGYATYHHYNLNIIDKNDKETTTQIEGIEKGDSHSFRPAIHSTLTEDLYISLNSAEENQITITAETNPLIILLWLGTITFSIGITMRLLTSKPINKNR